MASTACRYCSNILSAAARPSHLPTNLILPIDLPQEVDAQLRPLLEKAAQAAAFLEQKPERDPMVFDGPVLHGVGNLLFHVQKPVPREKENPISWLRRDRGSDLPARLAPFHAKSMTVSSPSRAGTRPISQAFSIAPVTLRHQGVRIARCSMADRKVNAYPGRFAIFSGGKF